MESRERLGCEEVLDEFEWKLRVAIFAVVIGIFMLSWVLFGTSQFTDWRAWFLFIVIGMTFQIGSVLGVRDYKARKSCQ